MTRNTLLLALCALLAACGGPTTTQQPEAPGQVTIRFLDVGQGDAVLIQSPEGKTVLVDGGKSKSVMQGYLSSLNVTKIDLMVASHFDADHITGLIPAAQSASPTLFINNGLAHDTVTYQTLIDTLKQAGTTFRTARDETINVGSLKVQVLAPPSGMNSDQNNNCVGIAVQFGHFRALMTGDSEAPETGGWLAQGRADIGGPFQIYKSIHHGAANGDTKAWLNRVQPQNVVISVGADNTYGHPTQTALDLYARAGARVYRTDQQGTVTVVARSDGNYQISTGR